MHFTSGWSWMSRPVRNVQMANAHFISAKIEENGMMS